MTRTTTHRLSEFLVGLLFGWGLMLAGMTDPGKVIGFLDLAGAWDPSLAFVMGGAIAVLSAQVDDMTRALQAAQGTAGQSSAALEAQVARAEAAAARLDLILAALHDLPEAGSGSQIRVLRRRSPRVEAAE